MEAYDAAVQEGRTNPCAYVQSLGLKGFYRSCIYKWKKTRQQDSWTVMRAASPRLAKKYRELPDVLRNLLGKQRKFIQRASNASGSATCILPAAFQDMVASAVVERIDLGEEVDFNYVVALLEVAIEQWNLCVKSMKEEMESPHAILEGIEHRGNFEPEDLDTAVNDMRAQSQMLREIALPPTSNAF
ncbi:unnamed protein product, partial [Durusdinium trenchii]